MSGRKWIKSNKELPVGGQVVAVSTHGGCLYFARYHSDTDRWRTVTGGVFAPKDIAYWIPVPELPDA